MIREDILYAYRQHLKLTGRSRTVTAVEMTEAELRERIRVMSDDEILTIDFFGGES